MIQIYYFKNNTKQKIVLKNVFQIEYIPIFYISSLDNIPDKIMLTKKEDFKTLSNDEYFYKFYYDNSTFEIFGSDLECIIFEF